jgi:hypothetical protein
MQLSPFPRGPDDLQHIILKSLTSRLVAIGSSRVQIFVRRAAVKSEVSHTFWEQPQKLWKGNISFRHLCLACLSVRPSDRMAKTWRPMQGFSLNLTCVFFEKMKVQKISAWLKSDKNNGAEYRLFSTSFYHPHNIGWGVQIIQLLILSAAQYWVSSTDYSAPHFISRTILGE